MSIGDFFAALYERLEGFGGYAVYGPKKGPFKTARIDERWEESVQGQEDIYFRLCPMEEKPEKGRGKQRKSSALSFVWLDMDCGQHKSGKNYFPDIEEAIKWTKEYVPWTAIVSSGTGLHVYCVLEEPLYINDSASFKRAYAASARFQRWAKEQCPYDIDSTHDLARVLRVPGTIHSGTGWPVTVTELRQNCVDIDVLESLPISGRVSTPSGDLGGNSNQNSHGFVLDPSRKLDGTVLSNLITINPKFAETWAGQRAPGDPSPSGWRLSMISFLMQAGLDRQDVADIALRFLIDQRGYAVEELKLDRPDIWAGEMTKCQVEKLNNDELDALVKDAPIDEQLGVIATLMEFPQTQRLKGLSRFLMMASDEEASGDVFLLHIETTMGDIIKVELKDIMTRTVCRKAIFSKTGIALPHYAGRAASEANRKWEQAVGIAWHAAEVLEPVQSETTELLMIAIKGQVNSELATSLEDAKATGNPFKDEDTYVVPTAALNSRAKNLYPELRANRELHAAVRELRHVGIYKQNQVYKGIRMACLLVPANLVEDDDE